MMNWSLPIAQALSKVPTVFRLASAVPVPVWEPRVRKIVSAKRFWLRFIMPMANSLTLCELASPVVVTTMPRRVQASISTLS